MNESTNISFLDARVGGRVEWIEIARIFATYLILVWHLFVSFDPCFTTVNLLLFFKGSIPFFFVVSGWFFTQSLMRSNEPLRFTFRRVVVMLVPFVFFSMLAAGVCWEEVLGEVTRNGLYGWIDVCKRVVGYRFFGYEHYPYAIHLWFLRDLMALTLLTPLVVRLPKPVLLTLPVVLMTSFLFVKQQCVLSAAYYCLGVFLCQSGMSLNAIARYIAPRAGTILLMVVVVNICTIWAQMGTGVSPLMGFHDASRVLGIVGIFSFAVLFCRWFPKASAFLAPYGRDMFFVYALHYILFLAFDKVQAAFGLYLGYWPAIVLAELSPIPVMVGCVVIIRLLRRVFPRFAGWISLSGGVGAKG